MKIFYLTIVVFFNKLQASLHVDLNLSSIVVQNCQKNENNFELTPEYVSNLSYILFFNKSEFLKEIFGNNVQEKARKLSLILLNELTERDSDLGLSLLQQILDSCFYTYNNLFDNLKNKFVFNNTFDISKFLCNGNKSDFRLLLKLQFPNLSEEIDRLTRDDVQDYKNYVAIEKKLN